MKLRIEKQNQLPSQYNNYQEEEAEEEINNSCSFRGEEDKTGVIIAYCGKPSFDKKKQLCRSHNRQVRQRFNQFTKDMSISSMAAWEMQWEQSGDWHYFWDLVAGKDNNKV